MSEELKEYQQQVEFFANTKNSIPLTNSSKEHAEIIMSNIFRTTEKYVYIFAGSLKGDVSSQMYLCELNKLLVRNTSSIKVVLESKPSSDNASEVLKLLFNLKKNSGKKEISIKYLNQGDAAIIFNGGNVKHFTIADDRMFREEDDTRNYLATASYNNPAKVAELISLYNLIDNKAIPLNSFPVS